jgi:hypothetical protein
MACLQDEARFSPRWEIKKANSMFRKMASQDGPNIFANPGLVRPFLRTTSGFRVTDQKNGIMPVPVSDAL